MGWTRQEQLVVLNEEGTYRLYDLQGEHTQFSLGSDAQETGVLEVLHTGPWFTGPGVFELAAVDGGALTEVRCTEIFDVVGGALPTRLAGLLLPVMRLAFGSSLEALGRVSRAVR